MRTKQHVVPEEVIKAEVQGWITKAFGEPQSTRELLTELRGGLAVYEEKYGLASDKLSVALTDGRIQETHEICCWLMEYDLFLRIMDEAKRLP